MFTNRHAIIRAKMLGVLMLLCACGEAKPQPIPLPTPESAVALADAEEARILAMSEPDGWIVSRWNDGSLAHAGDSLIWTGMAMGVMSCANGARPEAALLKALADHGGRFVRHPSDALRATSLDGHLGVYWGIAQRVRRCPESTPLWEAALATHEPVNVTGPFEQLLAAVKYQLGMAAKPRGTAALTDSVAAWTYGVVLTKAAAYRVHLGLLSLQILETTGAGLPAAARSKFCAASDDAGLPTVDHWCGRGNLLQWVSSFEPNRYEFAHQRAVWEKADGKPGLTTPGLDLLVAIRALYEF